MILHFWLSTGILFRHPLSIFTFSLLIFNEAEKMAPNPQNQISYFLCIKNPKYMSLHSMVFHLYFLSYFLVSHFSFVAYLFGTETKICLTVFICIGCWTGATHHRASSINGLSYFLSTASSQPIVILRCYGEILNNLMIAKLLFLGGSDLPLPTSHFVSL